jgi:hypothetical protein
MSTLRRVLSDPNNSNVCNGLFDLLLDRYDEHLDVTTASDPERAVLLVWQSYRIIGNGGFRLLLEEDFTGDPGFRHTAGAYRAIGCAAAADAFDRLFAAFPMGQLPSDIDRRLRLYRKHFSGFPNAVDGPFWAAPEEIEKCLAASIREHAAEFAHLR